MESAKSRRKKAVGKKAGWKRCKTKIRFRNKVFALREDKIELPDGKRKRFAYMERTDAVIIVPITAKGEMVLINQYRYSVDKWCLEVPAGGTHDKPNESLVDVARAELREEVGGVRETLTYVDYLFSASSLTDEKCHVFLAEGVELSEEPEKEAIEKIEVKVVPLKRALAFVHAGKMKDGQCALAILLCEPLLRKRTP
ncbi:MAG TPA: NUDIX hydrolase [Chthoniobacterales bacterium]|jgi:ADP-ribose pyrophosphatase